MTPYTYRNPHRLIIPALVATWGLLFSVLMIVNVTASAQGSATTTPTPFGDDWYTQTTEWDLPYYLPGTSEGDATWTVAESAFQSYYPSGFSFSTQATSDKGDIVQASVIWSHVPGKLTRRDATISSNGRIEARWFPDQSLPPWVAVNFYWSFADSQGNRYRTNWILGNEYADSDPQWSRIESDDVIVYIQSGLPDEILDLTVAAVAEEKDTYLAAWGEPLPYIPRVILFSNQFDFQQWRDAFGGTSVIGQTSDDWGATVQVISDEDSHRLAYGTVLHEIGHLYQFHIAPNAFPAGSWFTEGDATFFELDQQYDYKDRVRKLARRDQLPVILQGDGPISFEEGPDGIGRLGYDIGYTFFEWLTETFGLDAHHQLMHALADGTPRNEALVQVTGMSVVDIETAWREWLGAHGPAPTLIPTQAYRFPPTVTPFQFATSPSQ
ncbi:MAG: hypothetical protein HY862_18620 [Chloroflexi bacterium]|nr:hypothetical protein [Chloroflexota bacterium]